MGKLLHKWTMHTVPVAVHRNCSTLYETKLWAFNIDVQTLNTQLFCYCKLAFMHYYINRLLVWIHQKTLVVSILTFSLNSLTFSWFYNRTFLPYIHKTSSSLSIPCCTKILKRDQGKFILKYPQKPSQAALHQAIIVMKCYFAISKYNAWSYRDLDSLQIVWHDPQTGHKTVSVGLQDISRFFSAGIWVCWQRSVNFFIPKSELAVLHCKHGFWGVGVL